MLDRHFQSCFCPATSDAERPDGPPTGFEISENFTTMAEGLSYMENSRVWKLFNPP